MLKYISIKSNIVLAVLALLSITALIVVEKSRTDAVQVHYNEKFQASSLTKDMLDFIKLYRDKNAVYIDNVNDPNETGIIGQEFTQITTGRGSLPVKLSTTNPNTSALIVELFKEAGLKEGDHVAICATGSFPALNIATYAAIHSLGLKPIVISSTTSSTWGANDPEFTWLDMERVLHDQGFFPFRSIAASIGGNTDLGMTLSKKGRELIHQAIERNQLPMIKNNTLQENIDERMELFEQAAYPNQIKAYINIGGGIASLGSRKNGKKVKSGLSEILKLKDIPDKIGVMFEMAQKDIPIVHLLNLEKLMKQYDLPINPIPLPDVGEGELYEKEKYNIPITVGAALTIFITLSLVIFFDWKNNKLGEDIIKK